MYLTNLLTFFTNSDIYCRPVVRNKVKISKRTDILNDET